MTWPSWLSARRAEGAFVAATVLTFVFVVATTLGQPLLERHSFRQTQTAYTARIFHEQGIDLVHPKLPVLAEPFEAPFEFPLFQAAASLVMDAGVRDDVAMRLTGLACFVLTALLLYGLVRRVAGAPSALGALVAFVSTPFAVLWSRTSMIEYLATAAAVGFAWATIAWRENRRPAVGGLALAAGLVGMLVKPTTAVFWVLPALGYRPTAARPDGRRAGVLWLGALVLVPLAAALLWTRHADAIKGASPPTAWLTSDALREWNFGTVPQRLDPGTWSVIVDRLLEYVLRPVGVALIVVGIVAAVGSSQRRFWLGIGLAAVLPPLVFTNLYVVHDYYLAAVSPAFAALVGLGFGHLWAFLPRRPLVLGLAALGALVVASGMLVLERDYWAQAYANEPGAGTLTLAEELKQRTQPDDRVGVVGLDWSPELLYYADRWGHMVVERNRDLAYDTIRDDGYRYLVVADPAEADLTPLERWPWVGALGPHTYAIADDATQLSGSQFLSTDDPSAFSPDAEKSLSSRIAVPCGGPTRLRSGRTGTLIRISNPEPTGRVSISAELAPVPARRAIFVGPQIAGAGALDITCSGQEGLEVDVLEAPLPSDS